MYFWNIEGLKADLRERAVPASDVFGYIALVLLIMNAIFLLQPGSGPPPPPTAGDMFRWTLLATLVIQIVYWWRVARHLGAVRRVGA